jgi:hypothetical protein
MKLRLLRDGDVLEDGVRRLASCPHQVVPNSYHDA